MESEMVTLAPRAKPARRAQSYEDASSCFGRATFEFLSPLLPLARERPLELDDPRRARARTARPTAPR